MNKNTFTTVKLQKGEVSVYNFGKIKLHAYKTEDLISDEVFILEKDGRAVVIESPCFFRQRRGAYRLRKRTERKYRRYFNRLSRRRRTIFAKR